MPDQPTETTQTVTSTSSAEPQAQSPQTESREALYAKLYGQEPPAEKPVATPPAAAAEPDYKALFTQLAQEVAGLKQAITKPPETVEPPKPAEDWFALLQAGKRTEAEQTLKDYVANGAAKQIEQSVLVRAVELARTERDIEDFNRSVRAANPDLLDVEDLVSLKAQAKLAPLEPTFKSPKDYSDAYKRVVNEAVEDIRKLLQRTRAAAKNEAMTTRREVLASTTMNPNDIGRREQTADGSQPPQAEPDTSPQSYIEMRKAQSQQAAYTPEMRRVFNQQGN